MFCSWRSLSQGFCRWLVRITCVSYEQVSVLTLLKKCTAKTRSNCTQQSFDYLQSALYLCQKRQYCHDTTSWDDGTSSSYWSYWGSGSQSTADCHSIVCSRQQWRHRCCCCCCCCGCCSISAIAAEPRLALLCWFSDILDFWFCITARGIKIAGTYTVEMLFKQLLPIVVYLAYLVAFSNYDYSVWIYLKQLAETQLTWLRHTYRSRFTAHCKINK